MQCYRMLSLWKTQKHVSVSPGVVPTPGNQCDLHCVSGSSTSSWVGYGMPRGPHHSLPPGQEGDLTLVTRCHHQRKSLVNPVWSFAHFHPFKNTKRQQNFAQEGKLSSYCTLARGRPCSHSVFRYFRFWFSQSPAHQRPLPYNRKMGGKYSAHSFLEVNAAWGNLKIALYVLASTWQPQNYIDAVLWTPGFLFKCLNAHWQHLLGPYCVHCSAAHWDRKSVV